MSEEQNPVQIVVIAGTESARTQIAGLVAPAISGAVIAPCRRITDLDPAQLKHADIIVCEDAAPCHAGLQTVRRLHDRRPDLPIVVLCRDADAAHALEAIRAGAAESLRRDEWQTDMLPQALRRALDRRRAAVAASRRTKNLGGALGDAQSRILELQNLVEQLRADATTDPLTGLLNRRGLDDRLEEHYAAATRYSAELSCLALDLDGLKAVNDTLGHQAGDDCLRDLARTILAKCRRSDVAARIGGDELVVLLPHTPAPMARLLAGRLQHAFAEHVSPIREQLHARLGPVITVRAAGQRRAQQRESVPGVSIGVSSTADARATSPAALLRLADAALYAAKRAGGARVETVADLEIPPAPLRLAA